jgi:hypothetical protein
VVGGTSAESGWVNKCRVEDTSQYNYRPKSITALGAHSPILKDHSVASTAVWSEGRLHHGVQKALEEVDVHDPTGGIVLVGYKMFREGIDANVDVAIKLVCKEV